MHTLADEELEILCNELTIHEERADAFADFVTDLEAE